MKIFKTPRIFSWLFPVRTWGFSSSSQDVYLTFDDGPNPEITPWILDCLLQEKVKATFFCVGSNILKYPLLFERIKDEGHVVANHTYNHENSRKHSFKKYKQSVEATRKLVNNDIFRPPYGRIRFWNSYRLSKRYKIIMWSWLSYDYDGSVSVETILDNAEKQIKAGDILVLHDNDKVKDRVKLILPELLTILQKKGLKLRVIPANQ